MTVGFVGSGVGIGRFSSSVCVCRGEGEVSRRDVLFGVGLGFLLPREALAVVEPMPALKGRNYGKERKVYEDYTLTEDGLQYKDVRVGTGKTPKDGDRVVVDWEGYTIGYYGRIFAAKNRLKGGAFQDDQDFFRWVQGKHSVIRALEEAVSTMKEGGIRQIIIPPELGYPESDPKHDRVGPKPKTFSGQRALDFVLFNQVRPPPESPSKKKGTWKPLLFAPFSLSQQFSIFSHGSFPRSSCFSDSQTKPKSKPPFLPNPPPTKTNWTIETNMFVPKGSDRQDPADQSGAHPSRSAWRKEFQGVENGKLTAKKQRPVKLDKLEPLQWFEGKKEVERGKRRDASCCEDATAA